MGTEFWRNLAIAGLALSFGAVLPSLEAATPSAGKYRGITGNSSGRISFKVDRSGRKLTKLNVSITAPGQDTYGNFTKWYVIASKTDNRRFRISRSGKFRAKGVDKNGIGYDVQGKARGRNKFTGKVEMSLFNSYYEYNYYTGQYEFNSDLAAGTRKYKATR